MTISVDQLLSNIKHIKHLDTIPNKSHIHTCNKAKTGKMDVIQVKLPGTYGKNNNGQ
jgi:hypothetical protein